MQIIAIDNLKINMKKSSKIFIILQFILVPIYGIAQDNIAKSKIAGVGRFTNIGAELRWFPSNKTILRLGFEKGFNIERSDFGTNKFEIIATIKALPKDKWDLLIGKETNLETKSNLELAADFLFLEVIKEQKNINLDEGIAELNEQKGKEDMVYAVFVLTAIKDSKVAEALGLGYVDKTAMDGITYTYRIKLNGKSAIYEIEDGLINVKASLNPDKYKNEVFVYPGNKQLSFVWSAKPELSGYFVERKAAGENAFLQLNTVPIYASTGGGFEGIANGAYLDDSLQNYTTYYYRFFGLSAFGEKIMFAETKGMPRDLIPPSNPIIYQPKHTKTKEVLVNWDLYGDISDLRGFIVARSDRDTGNFTIINKTILSSKARSYSDSTFNAEGINYYMVYAMDTAGNISYSYPSYVVIIDSTPPTQPQIVNAIIDSFGIVTLTIKQGKEKDIKGYKLFKANSPEHEFSVIEEGYLNDKWDTNAVKLLFYDTVTLQSLTPKIYYRIKALDFNYNQSVFSEIAVVKRPDTIPPVTPVINNVLVSEKQIEIHFVPSESVDVKEHLVYRKIDFAADWEIILKFDSTQYSMIDTNVTTGVMYYYTLRAKDESNLFSGYASPVSGKTYDSGIRPLVQNFSVSIVNKKAVLKWDYPDIGKDVLFVIYKWNGNGQLTQYANTADKTFTDNNTKKENSYSIKAHTTDGGKSKMSEEVYIKMEE